MNYIKPVLVALVPILNIVGQILKKKIKSTNLLKTILVLLGIGVATIYGFVVSKETGWRLVLDAIVLTGLIQGVLIALASMGCYDFAIKPFLKEEK